MKRNSRVIAASLVLLPLAISSTWSVGQVQSGQVQSSRVQQGQTPPTPMVIDATVVPPPPTQLPFPLGGRSPDGHVLSANSRYLTLDGKPWFPVMGEFHYSRYPETDWESEIQKMKAAGLQIISTYVFWIHHEEVEGQFDWTGRRNLRRFVELCARNGLYVWVRIGPWDHGEVRNGGLPDWLIQKTRVRENNPVYLAAVDRSDREIGAQSKGFFWKDGGPSSAYSSRTNTARVDRERVRIIF